MRISESVKRIEPSLARALFNEAKLYDNVIDLTLGDPDFSTPKNICKAGSKSIKKGFTHYSANAGLIEARKAVANNVNKNWGIKPDAENEIILTVGGMEALFLSLACLINPGDDVIVFTPYYVNYVQMIRFLGGNPIMVNAYKKGVGFSLTKQELESQVTDKTVAIIVNSPNNPTGDIMNLELLNTIAQVAEQRGIVVISDEVYRSLVFDGIKHQSILNCVKNRENVILIDSCSKEFCMTGWRVGYAFACSEMIQAMIKLQENIAACAPLASQFALIEAYNNYTDNSKTRKAFEERRDYLAENINKIDKLSCVKPKGTFYMFVDIEQTGLNSLDFALELLRKQQVAVVPGKTYGEDYDKYVRIAFTKDVKQLEIAVSRIKAFIQSL